VLKAVPFGVMLFEVVPSLGTRTVVHVRPKRFAEHLS
jgi:hypothetical protein